MRISPDDRVASHAFGTQTEAMSNVRRWAIVRLILGFFQMFGAAFSLGLFLHNGITPLVLGAVLITGFFTGISMLMFQVQQHGQISSEQSAQRNRAR